MKDAAPYLWARASARREVGKYRDALSDMNEYEKLMSATINDNFYYIRHQTDIQARLYQQALNDIDEAIRINPKETLYYAEKASLQVRVGLFDEAEATAKECISIEPDNSDGYLFLGRSGTGKSTHSRLWLKHISGSELLNDDNPILRLLPDGSVRVFGSPWSGKTPCYKAKDVPVGAVVRLEQAPYNKIARLSPLEAYASLMGSASSFRPFRALADAWHETLNAMVPQVPCFKLECLPDREAALLCHQNVKRDAQAGDTH